MPISSQPTFSHDNPDFAEGNVDMSQTPNTTSAQVSESAQEHAAKVLSAHENPARFYDGSNIATQEK